MQTDTLLLIFGAVLFLAAGLFETGVPRVYRKRHCQGREWRRCFPNSSKQSIRQFLDLFASSFAIKPRHALKFCPDDELLAIYRARYPSRLLPDALELETLVQDLRDKHGIALMDVWHDRLTLGDLFRTVPPNNSFKPMPLRGTA